jgi:hypothetical protein
MRDPIDRAWSHARHNFRHRETNFASCTADFANVSDRQWIENFTQDWAVASGDYLGQLRRWLSVFPREQVYVGFYESLAGDPERLLRDVFAFLGLRDDVDLSAFPVRERIYAGLPGRLSPALHQALHRLLHNRSRELAAFLRDQFGLVPPPAWHETLAPPDGPAGAPEPPAVFARDRDDSCIGGVLAQEETFPSAWAPVVEGYRGFNIVFHKGALYALEQSLGRIWPGDIGPADLCRYRDERRCFVAPTLAAVKECVDQHLFERAEARARELPALWAELHATRDRLIRLEHAFNGAVHVLTQVQLDLRWFRPWLAFVNWVVRPLGRRLRSALGIRPPQTAEHAVQV